MWGRGGSAVWPWQVFSMDLHSISEPIKHSNFAVSCERWDLLGNITDSPQSGWITVVFTIPPETYAKSPLLCHTLHWPTYTESWAGIWLHVLQRDVFQIYKVGQMFAAGAQRQSYLSYQVWTSSITQQMRNEALKGDRRCSSCGNNNKLQTDGWKIHEIV